MTEIHVNVKNSWTLVYLNVAKWAVQTLHSFEVGDFFEVFSHNFSFCVGNCASFVHWAFVAEKSSKKFLAVVKRSEQFD